MHFITETKKFLPLSKIVSLKENFYTFLGLQYPSCVLPRLTLSVVVPAFNEEQYIAWTLESIIKHAPPNLIEIIVVDNASTDRTAEVALRFDKVKVVFEPKKGTGWARQKGFEKATGDLIAFIDADTLVNRRWFERVNREFAKTPGLVCLSGPYDYYDLPKHKQAAVWAWCLATWPVYTLIGHIVTGGNFVVKKNALLKIGGFNTKIPFYGDDTDIGKRLNRIGYVKFSTSFIADSSGRRFAVEGLLKLGIKYSLNYLSVALLSSPLSKKYKAIR